MPAAFAAWFFWPYMILALPQLFAINTIDLYSSGVTLQAIGIAVRRYQAVIIDTVVVAIVTALVIFKGDFYTDLTGFLLYIVVWLAPWFAIVMVDYLLRRGRYDPLSLAKERGGLYWRNGGFHWPAVIAQLLGMAAAMMWIYAEVLRALVRGADLLAHVGLRLQLADRHHRRRPRLLGPRLARSAQGGVAHVAADARPERRGRRGKLPGP